MSHCKAAGDGYFILNDCHWFVDAFHAKTKHAESHDFCTLWCIPTLFPDLMTGSKWTFNTSCCEQSNVWLGGFHSILRGMTTDRYNFFLDEVIKRRNEWLVKELEKKGQRPINKPLSELGITKIDPFAYPECVQRFPLDIPA